MTLIAKVIQNGNKHVGDVLLDNDRLVIHSIRDIPDVVLTPEDSMEMLSMRTNIDFDKLKVLYIKYNLSIRELCACVGKSYYKLAPLLKANGIKTNCGVGRLNGSFGTKFSAARVANMSNGLKGRKSPNEGKTLSAETKAKISAKVIQLWEDGVFNHTADLHRQNWVDGKYTGVFFGSGYSGTFFSDKNNCAVRFRSLLELDYYLRFETDDTVMMYQVEPFYIPLEDGSIYIPDVLIDNNLYEIKPSNYIKYATPEDWARFELEQKCASAYCISRGLTYSVLTDKDIKHKSGVYARYLKNNPDTIIKYQINFSNKVPVVDGVPVIK